MEKNGAGFRGILPMFKNDRSWFDCVEFIENSFEIYQVLYSHPYPCESWTIILGRPYPCGAWTTILIWTVTLSYGGTLSMFGVFLFGLLFL